MIRFVMCQEIITADYFPTFVIRFMKSTDHAIDRCTGHPIDPWTDQ